MAVIRINDLKVRALIGANSWEKINKQELFIHITLEYDASKASASDRLKDALNYETVAAKAIKTAEGSRHVLLEKLGAKLLAGVMSDPRVSFAQVRIDKPQALPQAKCVSFELSAEKNSSTKS
jgi:D-erythro-7,8-dihydroneopterin triphosphate epimerase